MMASYVSAGAVIGDRTHIYPGVFIGPGVVIGEDCVIKPGAVIGLDGFGYTHGPDGRWAPKPHEHGVFIDDDVHIGAGACIDRGSWRHTVIESGVRIDNLVHVAHNVIVRRNAVIVAQAMLAGSVEVCVGAWIAPGARVEQRLTIGPRALVATGAVVREDVPADQTWAGVPARCVDATQGVREAM